MLCSEGLNGVQGTTGGCSGKQVSWRESILNYVQAFRYVLLNSHNLGYATHKERIPEQPAPLGMRSKPRRVPLPFSSNSEGAFECPVLHFLRTGYFLVTLPVRFTRFASTSLTVSFTCFAQPTLRFVIPLQGKNEKWRLKRGGTLRGLLRLPSGAGCSSRLHFEAQRTEFRS